MAHEVAKPKSVRVVHNYLMRQTKKSHVEFVYLFKKSSSSNHINSEKYNKELPALKKESTSKHRLSGEKTRPFNVVDFAVNVTILSMNEKKREIKSANILTDNRSNINYQSRKQFSLFGLGHFDTNRFNESIKASLFSFHVIVFEKKISMLFLDIFF